jgi:hypothetical protein
MTELLRDSEVPLATKRTAAKYYSRSGSGTHIHGTHLPVEEPSTASITDIGRSASNIK